MAKAQAKKTVTPATTGNPNDTYQPIAPQEFTVNGVTLGYDYTRLQFVQVMLAEELADLKTKQLRDDRVLDFDAVEASGSADYMLDIAAILFKPIDETGAWKAWERHMRRANKQILEQMTNPEEYARLERCFADFFTRRGKRRIVSLTLYRDGALGTTLSKMIDKISSLTSSEQNTSTAEHGTPESSSAATTSA